MQGGHRQGEGDPSGWSQPEVQLWRRGSEAAAQGEMGPGHILDLRWEKKNGQGVLAHGLQNKQGGGTVRKIKSWQAEVEKAWGVRKSRTLAEISQTQSFLVYPCSSQHTAMRIQS